jgi:WD40 repeat protein
VYGAYEDGVIMEWLLTTGEIKSILKGHTARVSDLQLAIPEKFIVSGSND